MKRNNLFVLYATLTVAIAFFAQAIYAQSPSRCIASPEPVTIKQADGSYLTIIGKGYYDENTTETVDGYTVVKNAKDVYEYAVIDFEGKLKPGGIKASEELRRTKNELDFLQKQPKHLNAITDNGKRSKQLIPGGNDEHGDEDVKNVTASFPGKGKHKVLLILIEYPDLKSQYSKADFEDMMNKENYLNIGSYRDFYLRNSFGKLDLTTDVFGWYMADSSYKYYSNANGQSRARLLVAKAVDSAEKAGVDFSQYDNDGDGSVDGVMVVHSGPGAEEGSQTQYIWSHRWTLGGSQSRSYDGVKINNYAINPEARGGVNYRMVGIGVFCHEFGHLLGLPDLYDVSTESEGIGNWSVMAGGNWLNNEKTPANFCAWTRTYMDWITPVTITTDGFYILKPSSTDSTIYRVNTPASHEYFLLENRQFRGFDAKLNGKGLAIWHINDSAIMLGMNSNTVNSDETWKGIDLEEADGKDHLDKKTNRGDAGDLFPGSSNNSLFDDNSTPNAKNYSGKNSGLRIFSITQLTDSSIKFGFGAMPQASIAAVTIVCQNQPAFFGNNSQFANTYSWHFGDDNVTDTNKTVWHTFKEPGEYYVKLTAKSLGGIETMDSVKIKVQPSAVADFSMVVEGLNVVITNKSQNGKYYIWYWGDGKTGYNSGATFTRKYSEPGTYTIKLVVTGTGCNDTISQDVTVYWGTGLTENSADKTSAKVYPNPFSNKINVAFTLTEASPVTIEVYNMLGKRVHILYNGKMPEGEHVITTDGKAFFANGIYVLKLTANGGTSTFQMTKTE